MNRVVMFTAWVLAAPALLAAEPKYIPATDGTTAAVVVEGMLLIHSDQMNADDLSAFYRTIPRRYHSRIVKLNVCAKDLNAAEAARRLVKEQHPMNPPVTSFVVGKLADTNKSIAVDCVLAGPIDAGFSHAIRDGSRVYVSGQAEKGATPAEATRNTLASLKKTLDWLGCSTADVVQVKSFLKPITAVEDMKKEIEAAFGKGKVPPLVFVAWDSTLPIEIEMIANAPKPKEANPPAVEFLTPPGMTASPVFCRVTKVNAPETIYINGLYSAKTDRAGPDEVPDVFGQLADVLKKCDSDFLHLAKATYYVSANDVSAKLNDVRPKFYDPKRPPAASKAMVAGVGLKDRLFTMDMIAVKKR